MSNYGSRIAQTMRNVCGVLEAVAHSKSAPNIFFAMATTSKPSDSSDGLIDSGRGQGLFSSLAHFGNGQFAHEPPRSTSESDGGFCPAQGVLGLFQLLRSRKCALSPVVKACQCSIRLGECLFHIRKAGIAQFWSLKSAGGSRKAGKTTFSRSSGTRGIGP